MKLKTLFLVIGSLLIGAGLIANLSISQITSSVSSFAEQYFSTDQAITATSRTRIVLSILTAAAITIYFGVLLIAARDESTRYTLLKAIQDNPTRSFKQAKFKHYRIVILSTILTLIFIAIYVWRILNPALKDLYAEGNLVEVLTAITFWISSLFVLLAIISRLRIEKVRTGSGKLWLVPYISIMIGFLILALEEINWGQYYFGWQTPEALEQFNRQGETNLHNIIDAFEWLYYPLAILFPLEVIAGWLRRRVSHRSIVVRILPKPNTFFLAAILSTLAYVAVGINEFIEQLFAFFSLLYSYSIYNVEKNDLART